MEISKGLLVWTEYDMEKVIFHYSRKEELLKVDVGKVCMTCSGSGYVPQ